ncbi:alpha/beta fold hydrolase [Salinisphaera sp. Q1T1-3]|uniref:alpha/beta fold hydrolase n=1 Tax=Salinisphaera sp. Q1T1-3 TaxID=2321229 RepID=UPI000E706EDB|nr:alpha/beta hydrolase [Salinisphaera sp. Q1T1-3]RJS91502.1 alpha/beta hydrolase [Salinisphaera sp. Q1T1-3]
MAEFLAPALQGADIVDTVEANGLTLAYEQFGRTRDPALVLIVGLGMQLRAWPDAFCRALADTGLRVIRFDNRDIGLSTQIKTARRYPSPFKAFMRGVAKRPIGAPYQIEDMADDAVALMDALEITAAHLVGVSMGGMIAQVVAAREPERVKTLTSIMSTSGHPKLPRSRLRILLRLARAPKSRDAEDVAAHMARTMRLIGSRDPRLARSEEDWYSECLKNAERSYAPAGTHRQMLAVLSARSRRDLLSDIRQPALVIHGRDDPLLPVAHGRDTAAWLPNVHYEEVDGLGHDLPPRLLPRYVGWIRDLIDGELVMHRGEALERKAG